MPTYLQATAALQAARKVFDKAQAASAAAPGDKVKATAASTLAAALTAAYAATIDAAAGEPSLVAKRDALIEAKVVHKEKYEKTVTESDDKPAPSSAEVDSEEDAAASAAPATVDSARPSGMPPAKPKEKRGAKKAESEEDEENAIAASYARATGSYRREMAGKNVDALGVLYGPEALARACMKALGTTSIRETFGALAGLPEKLKASDAIVVDVEALKKRDRATRVEVMIEKAKAEGVAMSKEQRAYFRGLGATHGTAHLKGLLAMMPRLPTKALEPNEEGSAAQVGGDEQEKAIKEATALMPADQQEKFEKLMRANLKANAAKIPAA